MTRLDRGLYTVPIWLGLLCSGIYVLAVPPILSTIPNWAENLLAAELAASAGLCLVGSRIAEVGLAYRVELIGLAGIALVLGMLAVATDLTLIQQFTLTGALGAWIQLGSVRMMVDLGHEIRSERHARSSARIAESYSGERRLDSRPYGRAGR